jgi:predicted DNA-binding helix-hairpin-helix protein
LRLNTLQKLEILADAAKYDASCVSSGGDKRNAGKGLGSVTGRGICHAFTPDGRCVSLLKILLTNFCIYDCAYCVSRRSSNVARARFSVDEVVRLTLDLYKRNCIEGLFLSSGIARSVDDTMADLVRVAKCLREEHAFHGYIHLKTIPGASAELIAEAGRYADRLSMNVELPAKDSLERLAPEKSAAEIKRGLARTRAHIEASAEPTRGKARPPLRGGRTKHPDGGRRRSVVGRTDFAHQCESICLLCAEAGLLLRLQSDGPRVCAPANGSDAADARASTLSGRLAHAFLWLLAAGDRKRLAGRYAGFGD